MANWRMFNEKATLGKLAADGRITDKQVASYKAYYGKQQWTSVAAD